MRNTSSVAIGVHMHHPLLHVHNLWCVYTNPHPHPPTPIGQCVCDWRDRERLFLRLELEVRRDLAAGRLPPVQPFHAMAYPFPADLALAISKQYAAYCALTAARIAAPALSHPARTPLQPGALVALTACMVALSACMVARAACMVAHTSHMVACASCLHHMEHGWINMRHPPQEPCNARLLLASTGVHNHPPLDDPSGQRLRVGYVSSDFGNHPLSHLMGSVFGLHDRSRIEVFCYALSPSDGSEWRQRIERDAEHFVDVSSWGVADIAARISADGIHVAINLNGYTKGARNEIFALKPAPVQASYMGFPATTGTCSLSCRACGAASQPTFDGALDSR